MARESIGASFILLSLMIICASADNCFYDDHFHYIYDLPDYSGNYTNVKEYWMRMDTTCTFTLDTNCKLLWYSSDITSEF